MKYNRICLMLPTYGRSHSRLPEFLLSAIKMSEGHVCFSFCVNRRDQVTREYIKAQMSQYKEFDYEIIEEDLKEPHLAVYFNMMYCKSRFNTEGTVVSMVGDDMVFETKGYDTTILREINKHNGVGVFYCDDGGRFGEKLCVNLFVTREFVRATRSKFMCETFRANGIDVVWMKVGKLTDTLHYISSVVIRHNQAHITVPDPTSKRLAAGRLHASKYRYVYNPVAKKIAANLEKSGVLNE